MCLMLLAGFHLLLVLLLGYYNHQPILLLPKNGAVWAFSTTATSSSGMMIRRTPRSRNGDDENVNDCYRRRRPATSITTTAATTTTFTTTKRQRLMTRHLSSDPRRRHDTDSTTTTTATAAAAASRTETTDPPPSTSLHNDHNNIKRTTAPHKPPKRVTLRRYLHNIVKADPSLRDLESLSLSIQMACKTISNLVSRAGINSSSAMGMGSTSGGVASGNHSSFSSSSSSSRMEEEEEDRDVGLIQYDYRMNSMKRLDQLSTIVLRNALRFTGKLQSVEKAKDDDGSSSGGGGGGSNSSSSGSSSRGSGGASAGAASSSMEHQPGVLIASTLDSKYVAIFDPLDGSGNADAAICTGTVFGIFETEEAQQQQQEQQQQEQQQQQQEEEEGIDNVVLGGGDGTTIASTTSSPNILINSVLQPGKKLVAAGYCLYSSSTILVFTLGDGTHGFTLDPQINEFVLTHPNIQIPPRGNVYSCNEANSEGWSDDVKRYLHALKSGENETRERYALRYVGSMVGDIHRTLMYGGIFFYPADSKLYPRGHLQLLYKSAPLSFVIEQAGGKSTNGREDLLGVTPSKVHETSPCFIGSPEDIEEMKTFVMHA